MLILVTIVIVDIRVAWFYNASTTFFGRPILSQTLPREIFIVGASGTLGVVAVMLVVLGIKLMRHEW